MTAESSHNSTTEDAPAPNQAAQASREADHPGADGAPLDAIFLSALMSSRLCHDLVNPVGALSSGLDVLGDPDMDEEMREDALDLIKASTEKAVALLKFARLAYGQAGGVGAMIPYDEARDLLQGLYASSKADLDWRLPSGHGVKEEVKALLALVHAASECVPRGGVVTAAVAPDGDVGNFIVEAVGPRIFLNDETIKAIDGDGADLKPKQAPLYLAGVAARRAGGDLSARVEGDKVVMTLVFEEKPDMSGAIGQEALTAG